MYFYDIYTFMIYTYTHMYNTVFVTYFDFHLIVSCTCSSKWKSLYQQKSYSQLENRINHHQLNGYFCAESFLSFIINHSCCQWLKKLKMSITYLICKTNDFYTFSEVILNGWFKVDEFPNMEQNTRLENNLLKKLLEAATKFYFSK